MVFNSSPFRFQPLPSWSPTTVRSRRGRLQEPYARTYRLTQRRGRDSPKQDRRRYQKSGRGRPDVQHSLGHLRFAVVPKSSPNPTLPPFQFEAVWLLLGRAWGRVWGGFWGEFREGRPILPRRLADTLKKNDLHNFLFIRSPARWRTKSGAMFKELQVNFRNVREPLKKRFR